MLKSEGSLVVYKNRDKNKTHDEIKKSKNEKIAATCCGSYHQNNTHVYTLSTHDDDHMNRKTPFRDQSLKNV